MSEQPVSYGDVELWGRTFRVVERGIAVDEIVPFVAQLVFNLNRAMEQVRDLEQRQGSPIERARGTLPLWGKGFRLVDPGLAIEDAVPFMADLMHQVKRLTAELETQQRRLDHVGDLERLAEAKILEAHRILAERGVTDEVEAEAAPGAGVAPPGPVVPEVRPEPAARGAGSESGAAAAASGPLPPAEGDLAAGPQPQRAGPRPEAPPGPAIDDGVLYDGEVLLRFQEASSIADVVRVQDALATVQEIVGLLGVARGAQPGSLEVRVRLAEPTPLVRRLRAVPQFSVVAATRDSVHLRLAA